MIEFFVFLGCFLLTAAVGIYAVYLGLLILAAFLLLYVYSKKSESEYIKELLTDLKEYVAGIGLFVVVAGILFMSKEPFSPATSEAIVFIVKIVGGLLFTMLLLSPIAIYIHRHTKGISKRK